MSVVCNIAKTCRFHKHDQFGCGGATPHEPCDECGKCHIYPEAKCVEIPPAEPAEAAVNSTQHAK
jgi:hypothetical protein